MTFGEIEQVIGSKLPPSAYRHRPWWANEAANHVHAKAWLSAGYRTEQVDMAGKKLIFKRAHFPSPPSGGPAAESRGGLGEPMRAFQDDSAKNPAARHPLIGALKGWLIVEPGYDLTQPAMPEWAELADRKYGRENPQ